MATNQPKGAEIKTLAGPLRKKSQLKMQTKARIKIIAGHELELN